MSDRSKLEAHSPFLTERARQRAPQILAYAAATGAAVLLSPAGHVVLLGGAVEDIDLDRLARTARKLGAARRHASFRLGAGCVHAGPVRDGWALCVMSLPEIATAVTVERLRKAAHVLALALADGVPPGSSGGGGGPLPAEAFAFLQQKRN